MNPPVETAAPRARRAARRFARSLAPLLLALGLLGGCANETTAVGAGGGAVVGAGVGAILGGWNGAAVGAMMGAVAGGAIGSVLSEPEEPLRDDGDALIDDVVLATSTSTILLTRDGGVVKVGRAGPLAHGS